MDWTSTTTCAGRSSRRLASVNQIDEAGIDTELAKRDTTANREFAMGARASRSTPRPRNGMERGHPQPELTNMQLEAVARGFAGATPELADPYVERYFAEAIGSGRTARSTWPRRCSKALCRCTPTRPSWSSRATLAGLPRRGGQRVPPHRDRQPGKRPPLAQGARLERRAVS